MVSNDAERIRRQLQLFHRASSGATSVINSCGDCRSKVLLAMVRTRTNSYEHARADAHVPCTCNVPPSRPHAHAPRPHIHTATHSRTNPHTRTNECPLVVSLFVLASIVLFVLVCGYIAHRSCLPSVPNTCKRIPLVPKHHSLPIPVCYSFDHEDNLPFALSLTLSLFPPLRPNPFLFLHSVSFFLFSC